MNNLTAAITKIRNGYEVVVGYGPRQLDVAGNPLQPMLVKDKRAARKLATDMGATPWNF